MNKYMAVRLIHHFSSERSSRPARRSEDPSRVLDSSVYSEPYMSFCFLSGHVLDLPRTTDRFREISRPDY